MTHRGRQFVQELFDQLFPDNADGLLCETPDWVKSALGRRIRSGKLVLVSAVCPDYERRNGRFTYRGMGAGLPFTAAQHLPLVQRIQRVVSEVGAVLDYHITLADTEFDLPLVVEHLVGGDAALFLERCEASCVELAREARALGLPLRRCGRFTEIFPDWFLKYEQALEIINWELKRDHSVRQDVELGTYSRLPLHRAMAGRGVTADYSRKIVVRQLAQYMAWGECAEKVFGEGLVMMNHTTPNLSRVNHQAFRAGRERIPIIQLDISTMPDEQDTAE